VTLHADKDHSSSNTIVGIARPGSAAGSPPPAPSRADVADAVTAAVSTIAPLWPLKTFVAVNPFLGISSVPYADADNTVDRIWGARLVMPRPFYARAIRDRYVRPRHVEEALTEFDHGVISSYTADSIRILAFTEEPESQPTPTLADVLAEASGYDWPGFVIDRVSFWSASYYDEGQASLRSPWRNEPPFQAWRSEAELDRTQELIGINSFRAVVRALPDDPDELLYYAAERLRLSRDVFEIYLRRMLATIAGWAGHARYRGWQKELAGGSDDRVKALLAVRVAWDLALLEAFNGEFPDLDEVLRQRLATPMHPDIARAHLVNLVLHTAYEIAGRESMLDNIRAAATEKSETADTVATLRPSAQVVFCIDVRSERYRRALESVSEGIETLGFAGFFGFAIEVAPIDRASGGAQCPVLLTPQYLVRETAPGASEAEVERLREATWLERQFAAVRKQFSAAAIASFAFVESLGLAFAWKLIADTFRLGLPGRDKQLSPSVAPSDVDGRAAGIPLAERVELARGALQGMSLTEGFAPVVLLIGHGATTANNPYASRYNCGACGGHTGEANSVVAAAVLNDAEVRGELRAGGIDIPVDTVFVPGLHDTTTDEVRLLFPEGVPEGHSTRIQQLEEAFDQASRIARRERVASFGPEDASGDPEKVVARRSTDWSEIRPEWGLAGCMAFIAAPRERTAGIDLGGRAFLHSYDYRQDEDNAVLELIMTAPLMVAGWISLQYYASTVDNDVFGSGDKTLHNVVGGLGVLEGNGGDLRVGLPMQTLHDGKRHVHEPLRLNALLEAPTEAIERVLDAHPHVRELVDNGWIHLFAIEQEGRVIRRYRAREGWVEQSPAAAAEEAAGRRWMVRRA